MFSLISREKPSGFGKGVFWKRVFQKSPLSRDSGECRVVEILENPQTVEKIKRTIRPLLEILESLDSRGFRDSRGFSSERSFRNDPFSGPKASEFLPDGRGGGEDRRFIPKSSSREVCALVSFLNCVP